MSPERGAESADAVPATPGGPATKWSAGWDGLPGKEACICTRSMLSASAEAQSAKFDPCQLWVEVAARARDDGQTVRVGDGSAPAAPLEMLRRTTGISAVPNQSWVRAAPADPRRDEVLTTEYDRGVRGGTVRAAAYGRGAARRAAGRETRD
jgi:hypothetical protein